MPDQGVRAQGAERWHRVRRLATSISAVIAAIGIAFALVGYLTTGAQFFSDIEEYFRGRSELPALITAADDRLARADYEAAWRTNAKARHLARRNVAAAEQQARIAMRWLEDVHLSSGGGQQRFSDVIDPLKAALVERLAGTHGRDKADLHAHIGWANFLCYRDGRPKTDIGEQFDAAIREDPDNLYGHVMRGFWILWEGGPIDKARGDLETALRSTTDPAFSDRLIMGGLTNITSDDFMMAAIEYANKIRVAGRNIDDRTKGRLIWYYTICLYDKNVLKTIDGTLPAREQMLLLDWLKQANVSPYDRRVAAYFTAYFAEKSGNKDEALQLFKELVRTSPDKGESIARLSQAAARRLQKR
jgi:tetratricopeptide (TPR) repeat protein